MMRTVISGPLSPQFNGRIVFAGSDQTGQVGLFVTDGTSRGTSELTMASACTHAGTSGFKPRNSAVFQNKVFFDGYDTLGRFSLFVTNGTTATDTNPG